MQRTNVWLPEGKEVEGWIDEGDQEVQTPGY